MGWFIAIFWPITVIAAAAFGWWAKGKWGGVVKEKVTKEI